MRCDMVSTILFLLLTATPIGRIPPSVPSVQKPTSSEQLAGTWDWEGARDSCKDNPRPLIPRTDSSGQFLLVGWEGPVLNVFVDPTHRRQGVARRLMEGLIGWAPGSQRANQGKVGTWVLRRSAQWRSRRLPATS